MGHRAAVCRRHPAAPGDPPLKPYPDALFALTPWQRWLAIGRAQRERFDADRALPTDPPHVLVFSGHMADAPGRAVPRLPRVKLDAAAARIAAVLAQIGAGPGDLAITQGASGGDLLFAEACLARDVALQLMLPRPEKAFARDSLKPSDGGLTWKDRYDAVKRRCPAAPVVLGEAGFDAPPTVNIYEACNRWQLATAVAYGVERLHFVCLWDGGGGDGDGGTRDFVDEVRRMGGRTHWIDTRTL